MESALNHYKQCQHHDASRFGTRLAVAVCGCGHDGRLGLGACDSQNRITLVPFFLRDTDGRDESPIGIIRAVSVGGYHNFVITTTGVYVWGLNENGQLGLGRSSGEYVSVPTRVPFFDRADVIDIQCGAYHTFAWTSDGLFACGRNDHGQLGRQDENDHFEFTSILRAAQANKGDATFEGVEEGCSLIQSGQLTHVSCGTHHTLLAFRDVVVVTQGEDSEERLQHHPLLVAAAGMGDFGELGYDGDEWSVLQSKARTMQLALRAETHRLYEDVFSPTVQSPTEKRWKPLKQRRASFSSARFQPARLPVLFEQVETSSDTPPLEICGLHAMHLHSAVTLRQTPKTRTNSAADRTRVFHWGCYYCNAVEDGASSIPVEDEEGVRLHAGNETLFRYATSALSPIVEVLGSGILGLGEEDSFVPAWTQLQLPAPPHGEALPPVRAVVGREHYLIQLGDTTVVGFGDNMHGQIGICGAETDVVLLPSIVLRSGDVVPAFLTTSAAAAGGDVASQWMVKAIRSVACGLRHSVLLLEVCTVAEEHNPSTM